MLGVLEGQQCVYTAPSFSLIAANNGPSSLHRAVHGLLPTTAQRPKP